jgi:hypothetical protein
VGSRSDPVTTAPLPGQPAAAFPVAPRSGPAGLLAVPAAVVAAAPVVAGDRDVRTELPRAVPATLAAVAAESPAMSS